MIDEKKLVEILYALNGKIPSKNLINQARILFVKTLDDENKIKIQTIHSFCQTVIRIFPFECGIQPNFEVIEESREKLLLVEAQKLFLIDATKNEKLKEIVAKISKKLKDKTLHSLTFELASQKTKIYSLKENFLSIDQITEEIFRKFSVEKELSKEDLFFRFLEKINFEEIKNLINHLENSKSKRDKDFLKDFRKFLAEPIYNNFKIYKNCFFTKENSTRKFTKEIIEDEILNKIITYQQKIISEFDYKITNYQICCDSELMIRFIDHILEKYNQIKKANGFLDYNDLIVETNKLLKNPNFSNWVKQKIDSGFDHILVDESQDTNHDQWNIIKAISDDYFSGIGASNKERTIFIVGDEKQSIFGFQGSDPNINYNIFKFFEEKLSNYSKKLHQVEIQNSFRSLSNVLEFTDLIFSKEENRLAISKITNSCKHYPIKTGRGKVEIWPQIKRNGNLKNSDEEIFQIATNQEDAAEKDFLAEVIAMKIRDQIDNKKKLEFYQREVRYDDYMILLRNQTNGFDVSIKKFFYKYKIPFSSLNKIKTKENIAIKSLIYIAKFCLLTSDDYNLLNLLKSPFFCLSEEEILQTSIIKNEKKCSLFEAIKKIEFYSTIADKLDEIIILSKKFNCFEFFYFLLKKEEYQKNFIKKFGHQSTKIIDQFMLKIIEFNDSSFFSLQKFIEKIEKLDYSISVNNNSENSVKISTIHSAKGLQSPIVFLPDCSYDVNKIISSQEKILWINFDNHQFPIWTNSRKLENKILQNHQTKKNKDGKEEYLRLLYVAITRAEEEIYIGGYGNKKNKESWYEIICESLKNNQSNKFQEPFLNEKEMKFLQQNLPKVEFENDKFIVK
jgi:ATP-dependent helicase/nuclease subunit A